MIPAVQDPEALSPGPVIEAPHGPFQLEDPNAGPRRITIDDEDVMYVALYGSGQLMAFDIEAREMVGVYDLPAGEVQVKVPNKTDGDYVMADAVRWTPVARATDQVASR